MYGLVAQEERRPACFAPADQVRRTLDLWGSTKFTFLRCFLRVNRNLIRG